MSKDFWTCKVSLLDGIVFDRAEKAGGVKSHVVLIKSRNFSVITKVLSRKFTLLLLGAFCEMIRFINCVAQFVNSQNALQFIKKR